MGFYDNTRIKGAAPAPAPAPEPVAEEVVDLASLTKNELKELAEERGLSTSGTKAELIERLGG